MFLEEFSHSNWYDLVQSVQLVILVPGQGIYRVQYYICGHIQKWGHLDMLKANAYLITHKVNDTHIQKREIGKTFLNFKIGCKI